MVAFDARGNVRWVVPNEQPRIATADGGVIGQSGITYDSNGNATGQMSLLTQSWMGNSYQLAPLEQVAAVQYLFGASFMALAGGQFSPGAAFAPVDSVTNHTVNGDVSGMLTPNLWQNFKGSHCAQIFGNPSGIPQQFNPSVGFAKYDPTMHDVQTRQRQLNFYDTTNPRVANFTVSEVLAGKRTSTVLANQMNMTLPNYLAIATATAATLVLGAPGPVILVQGFFNGPYPKVSLVHEVFHHAYLGWSDTQILNDLYFQQNGLPVGAAGSKVITDWMSTDCCNPSKTTCTAGSASWGT
jgi:hypothetical protein